jgi:5'-phosphate synthase pdxT subunit
MTMRIGVLALQGGFAAHIAALRELDHEVVEVRNARDMDGVMGLVLPGGESTAIRHLLASDGGELSSRLSALHACGAPILATCAGLILIAREIVSPPAHSLGWIDVSVSRNAWGRQVASGTVIADDGQTSLVLIRAPRIVSCAPHVEVLATLRGEPMLVRQGNVFGATFHPELDRDRQIHRMVLGSAIDTAL